jgi:hypothetical protein
MGGKDPVNKKLWYLVACFLLFVLVLRAGGQDSRNGFYWRGALYFDWFGAKYEDIDFFHQLSSRLKLEMVNRRGDGWTVLLDTRDRLRLSEKSGNQVILYDARILFDKQGSPLFLSLGQMNLYDTAGIGQLMGGVVGYKISQDLLLGGYGGLESSIYVNRLENDYQKYGVFARYQGSYGRRFSLSYNHLRYSGSTERQSIYAGTMFSFVKTLTFYGNLEYELSSSVRSEDRLSRIFANVRWDPARTVDMTAFYSSGKGLDYHRFILEKSQDPNLNGTELERFYYSSQYGLRLSIKPIRSLRFHVSRMESEQKDLEIRNHTWRFGGSAGDILKSGLTLYGNYGWNRGEMSESDSFDVAMSKDFGRVSWHGSFSNTFNGIRYDYRTDTPEIIHLNDYKTFTTQFFSPISRLIAASLEYEYFIQKESNQHLFFVRLILRN